jgi:hypothetical protein
MLTISSTRCTAARTDWKIYGIIKTTSAYKLHHANEKRRRAQNSQYDMGHGRAKRKARPVARLPLGVTLNLISKEKSSSSSAEIAM